MIVLLRIYVIEKHYMNGVYDLADKTDKRINTFSESNIDQETIPNIRRIAT